MKTFKQYIKEEIKPEDFWRSKPKDPYQHVAHNSVVDGHILSVKFINSHKGTKNYDVHYDVNGESDKESSKVVDPKTQVRIGMRVKSVVAAFHRHFGPSSITAMAADKDPAIRQKKHKFNTHFIQKLNPKKMTAKGNVTTGYF